MEFITFQGTEASAGDPKKRKFKRLHQSKCGGARLEYDSYSDVREACERKLAEWERQGIMAPCPMRGNDWLFGAGGAGASGGNQATTSSGT